MKFCACGKTIPKSITIDGQRRNLQNRTKCLNCLPFGHSPYRPKTIEEKRSKNALKAKRWYYKQRNALGQCPIAAKHNQRRNFIIALTNGCQFCGYNKCQRNIVFHHLHDKRLKLSSREFNTSWDKLLAELSKCCVCCHDCHGEIHDGLIDQKTIIDYHKRFAALLGSVGIEPTCDRL